jgi:hypothetical protein
MESQSVKQYWDLKWNILAWKLMPTRIFIIPTNGAKEQNCGNSRAAGFLEETSRHCLRLYEARLTTRHIALTRRLLGIVSSAPIRSHIHHHLQLPSSLTFYFLMSSTGKTAQMQPLLQVIPNARRSALSHVRPQRIVALQVSNLLARLQQADQPQESSLPPHR